MDILGIPFKKKRNGEAIRWLRVHLYQLSDAIKLDVFDPACHNFFFTVTLDQDAYLKIQKEQSIKVSFADFSKRLAVLLDFCILHMYCDCVMETKYTCVFNEDETDSNSYKLFITEQD